MMHFRALKNNHFLSQRWQVDRRVELQPFPYRVAIDAEPRARGVWAMYWVLHSPTR